MKNLSILRYTFTLAVYWLSTIPTFAQQILTIPLPDVEIWATRLRQGNADIYGRGDWQIHFTASLEGANLLLKGNILFSEKADDFTEIAGSFEQILHIQALEICQSCQLRPMIEKGTVKGKNIGARGFRWFAGQGLIRRAWVRTDTFGDDVGFIGGKVEFEPFSVSVQCLYAVKDSQFPWEECQNKVQK